MACWTPSREACCPSDSVPLRRPGPSSIELLQSPIHFHHAYWTICTPPQDFFPSRRLPQPCFASRKAKTPSATGSPTAVGSPTATGITAVLPNGREIHPAGNWIPLAPYPFALAMRPDGEQLAVPSIGFPFALNIIDRPDSAQPKVTRMPAGSENDPKHGSARRAGLFAGWVASLRGHRRLGQDPRLPHQRLACRASSSPSTARLSGNNFGGSFAATLRHLRPTEKRSTLSIKATGAWWSSTPIAWSASRPFPPAHIRSGWPSRLTAIASIVTNTGLFEYSTVPGASENDAAPHRAALPAFRLPSKRPAKASPTEGKQIHGLGDENSEQGSSLWTYDMSDREHPAVTAKLRLGARISGRGR